MRSHNGSPRSGLSPKRGISEDRTQTLRSETTCCSSQPVQVIICSCKSQVNASDIHMISPYDLATTPTGQSYQQVLHLLQTGPPPIPTALPSLLQVSLPSIAYTVNDALVYISHLGLAARAQKYICNPFRLFSLANRGRVQIQGLLSVRLLFNIWVVVVWVLIRKFLEVFGIVIGSRWMVDRTPREWGSVSDDASRWSGRRKHTSA